MSLPPDYYRTQLHALFDRNTIEWRCEVDRDETGRTFWAKYTLPYRPDVYLKYGYGSSKSAAKEYAAKEALEIMLGLGYQVNPRR